MRLWNTSLGNLLAIYHQGAFSTRARFRRIDNELVPDFVFTGRNRSSTGDVGSFYAKEIVFVMDFALLHIKRPTAERAGLGDDYAVCVGIL